MPMTDNDFKVSLGMTRLWDAFEAGKEVARTAISDLNEIPSFVILFSTIHYEKNGGFEEFLRGVWTVIPKGIPLIGGTVAGFANNHGCYSRGATALAVASDVMDVAVGIGKNTKRNPKKAAYSCSQQLKNGLKDSQNKEKFVINIVSGPCAIELPGQGQKKVINSGLTSKFVKQAFGISQYLLQKGLGREDEVFEKMTEFLPDFKMILGTSMDDYQGFSNYQFCGEKVLKNCMVSLAFSSNIKIGVSTSHGMVSSGKGFEITKLSRDGHIIQKINNKPAVQEFLRMLKWPPDYLTESTMLSTIIYYPISLHRHGREMPVVMPVILKDWIMTPCKTDKGKAEILTVDGRRLISALHQTLEDSSSIHSEFALCSACMTILESLGGNIKKLQEKMNEELENKPFIMFFCAGEGTYTPNQSLNYANMSLNTAVFGK